MEQTRIQSDSPGVASREVRILIVEDETLLSWSLAHRLLKAGFIVTTVDAGDKAIEELASKDFDLVITDMKLPHIDGLEIVARIKIRSPRMPVIMISALPDDAVRDSLEQMHIDHLVEKPFDLDEMTSMVEALVRGPAEPTLQRSGL